jgi:hypothetical protein
MARFNLLYATKVNLGGWATFTVHLYNLLVEAGHEVYLYKIGNNTELFTRPFGDHGVRYQNMSVADLPHMLDDYCIIAALGKHYVDDIQPLLASGAGIVVHDTAESTNRMTIRKPWVIRRSLLPLFDDAVFIRHPYMPHQGGLGIRAMDKRKGLVATSRVDFDKNTTMILDANRMGAGVDIVGFENRLYTKFKVCPDYPEWEQSKGTHPRSGAASFQLLRSARAMVDLTDIKRDGGGTQYTFLEAWDAGAVPIIGAWWLRPKDDMIAATNCLAITDATDLAVLAKKVRGKTILPQLEELAANGRKRLAKYHSPKVLAPQIVDWMESLS